MATGWQVLEMLITTGGWSILGNDYEGIQFNEAQPITKAEFEAGFAQYDSWKAEQDSKAVADKAAADKAIAEAKAAAEKVAAELKAKQEAEAKAAAELKAKQEAEAKAAALKKSTITCIKGKLTKKVTAVKPKCPSGYKVKK